MTGNRRMKVLVAIGLAAAVLGGVSFAAAAGGDDDRPLTGSALDRATAAALEHTGGGTVIETEVGDGGAAYGVEIRRADGTVVEVNLNERFEVIGSEADDDGPQDQDGPNDD